MGVHPVAQVVLDAERDAARNQAAGDAEAEPQDSGGEEDRHQWPQVRAPVPDPVHGLPDDERDEHAGAHRHRGQREGHDHSSAIGTEEAEKPYEDLHRTYFTL